MATYILFWNPDISSYTEERFLEDFVRNKAVDNWSIHEWENVQYDDRFYMVKCGSGNTGIVMKGLFVGECYEDEDWSPKNRRPIYYADIEPIISINAFATNRLLTPDILTREMPDFNWYGGHSGRLLTPEQARKLDALWKKYIRENAFLFTEGLAFEDDYNKGM